jgi:hypothetical protein
MPKKNQEIIDNILVYLIIHTLVFLLRFIMTLDDCRKCKFHTSFQNGQILCKYLSNLDSLAVSENKTETMVIGCPIDS